MKDIPREIKRILNEFEDPLLLVSDEGRVIYANDKFLSLKGYKIRDIVGKNLEEIFGSSILKKDIRFIRFFPDLIFEIKKDGTIVNYFGNRNKLLIPPEEFLGKKIQDVMPKDIGKDAMEVIKKVFNTGKKEEFEYSLPLPYPDGEPHFFEARIIKADKDGVIAIIRDITERKNWENKLKDSERRFKLLSEMTPSAVFMHDGDRYLYVNPYMEKLTGYSKEELLKMKLWEVIHPDYRERVKSFAKRRVLGEDVPDRYEIRVLSKDGREHWVKVYARRIEYKGKFVVLGTAFDITDLKRVEKALRESEEKFRKIFENAGIGITLLDKDGNFIECNSYFKRFVGYKKEEMVGKHWSIFTYPEDIDRNVKEFERMVREGRSFVIEKRFKRKDGKVVWGRLYASPLFDDEGRFLFQIGMVEDITKEKNFFEALKESEEKYRTLVEKMSEGVYLLYNNRFEFVNKKFTQMFGYTKEELKNINYRKLIAPESLPIIEERARKIKMGEKVPETYQFVALTKRGKKVYVEVSVSYVPYKGGVATQGIVRDITEKKIYEDKLKYMATHDILTGLMNRSYFMDFLRASIEASKRYGHLTCVMMLDLDGFKEINDKLGHDVGDRVLVKAAERLRRSVRRSDIVSRMGGDEFLILVPILKSVKDAVSMGDKIVNSFRKPLEVDGNFYPITVSVGASIFPQDGESAIELIKKADRAMYKVKRSGKDGFSLYSDLLKEGR